MHQDMKTKTLQKLFHIRNKMRQLQAACGYRLDSEQKRNISGQLMNLRTIDELKGLWISILLILTF